MFLSDKFVYLGISTISVLADLRLHQKKRNEKDSAVEQPPQMFLVAT